MKEDIHLLSYASDMLQNDKDLLLLLEKNNKKITRYRQGWYKERMQVLSKYKEKEAMEQILGKNVLMKKSNNKF
jgi:hypothetical protein